MDNQRGRLLPITLGQSASGANPQTFQTAVVHVVQSFVELFQPQR